MRTGKDRKFAVDPERMKRITERFEDGKGLVGGDINRVPHKRRGLRPFLDTENPPEIRRFPETPEEEQEKQAFLQNRPMEIEIGFGGGNFILGQARQDPETTFLAFEIRRNLCMDVVKKIEKEGLKNIRVCYEDVRQSIPDLFEDHSISRCSIFFPDPWWKKRHMKRRILAPPLLNLLYEKLIPGGILHVKTDVMPYGELIEELFAQDSRYKKIDESQDHIFENDQPTEREAFCQKKELPFMDFRFKT